MRGKTRTDEEREPKNEIITSRIRDDSDLSSSLGSSGISSGSNHDSEKKSSSSEDDSLIEEEVRKIIEYVKRDCKIYREFYFSNFLSPNKNRIIC